MELGPTLNPEELPVKLAQYQIHDFTDKLSKI